MTLAPNHQFARFALGSWFGFLLSWECEMLWMPPEHSPRDIPLEYLFAGYVVLSLLLALLFLGWINIRSRWTGRNCEVSWPIPLFLGVAYFPTLSFLVAALIRLAANGSVLLIGWSVLALLLSLPILFAEITFRISQRSGFISAPSRS